MKMLILIGPEGREHDLRALIENHHIHSYSEFRGVIGTGRTGRHLGTPVFPGTLVMIFTVVEDPKVQELRDAVEKFRSTMYADESVRVFILPVEEML
jgi:hypothetical protein